MDLFIQRIFVWVKIKIFVLLTEFSYKSYLLTVCKTCSLCAEVGFILFCILYISSSLYILFGIPSFAFKYQCHLHPSSVSRVINNKAFDCHRTDTNSGVNFWVFKYFFFCFVRETFCNSYFVIFGAHLQLMPFLTIFKCRRAGYQWNIPYSLSQPREDVDRGMVWKNVSIKPWKVMSFVLDFISREYKCIDPLTPKIWM